MIDMSTATPNNDERQPEHGTSFAGEAQELLDRLRSAPAEEIIADLFSTLLSAAQVKLGRRDARLFIDLCSETLRYSRPHLPDELTRQVDTALGQLRLAQVSAENEGGARDKPEPNDVRTIPRPPPDRAPGAADAGQQASTPSSTLWIPGR
jgi:hypothetical protein